MKSWQRILVIVMLGSFPFAVYLFAHSTGGSPQVPSKNLPLAREPRTEKPASLTPRNSEMALAELNRGIDNKAREIQTINDQILESNVKIIEAKDDITRYEGDKKAVIKDLEAFQNKLSIMLSEIKTSEKTSQ